MTPFLQLLVRYIAAIFLACVVSFVSAFFGIFIVVFILDSCPPFLDKFLFFALFSFVGLAGVFSGTVCLKRNSWRYGSILLLGLGLGFYTCFWLLFSYGTPPFDYRGFPHFWSLAIGGLVAVLFFWLRPSKR
jgi:hypothetical protein